MKDITKGLGSHKEVDEVMETVTLVSDDEKSDVFYAGNDDEESEDLENEEEIDVQLPSCSKSFVLNKSGGGNKSMNWSWRESEDIKKPARSKTPEKSLSSKKKSKKNKKAKKRD